MNVLIINRVRCNPMNGGIEACSHTLACGLHERGHKVYFLYTSRISLPSDFQAPVPEYVMPSDVDYCYDDAAKAFYHNLLRSLDIDTVLYQRAILDSRYFHLDSIPRDVKVRCVAAIHCSPLHRVFPYREQYRLVGYGANYLPWLFRRYFAFKLKREYRYLTSIAHAVVMLSPSYIDNVRNFAAIDTSHYVAIPNSYGRSNRQLPARKDKLILFVGRFTRAEKNPMLFAKMWQRIATQFPDWHAVMVGEGPDLERVKSHIEKHKLSNITIEQPRQSLDELYARAAVLVNTSYSESFGNVLVEAMAHGCVPVAGPCCGAAPDIFGSDAGVIVPQLTPKAFAHEVSRLLASPELLASMSQAAFARSEQFSPSLYIDRWEKVLQG